MPEEEQRQYDKYIKDQEARQHAKPLSALAHQQQSKEASSTKEVPSTREASSTKEASKKAPSKESQQKKLSLQLPVQLAPPVHRTPPVVKLSLVVPTHKESSKDASKENHEKKLLQQAFISPKKLFSSPKEETRIVQDDYEEAKEPPLETYTEPTSTSSDTDSDSDNDSDVEPIIQKEKYQPLKPTHQDKSYKADHERRFNIQEEIEKTLEDNTIEDDGYKQELLNILHRLDDLEGALPGISTAFNDLDDNMKELRTDIDRNNKYTLELLKAKVTPDKVTKYINRIRDSRTAIKDIMNMLDDLNTGFYIRKNTKSSFGPTRT